MAENGRVTKTLIKYWYDYILVPFTLADYLVVCLNYVYAYLWLRNFAFNYQPKKNACVCPPKVLCKNVHSSCIHNNPNLETIQCLSIREL